MSENPGPMELAAVAEVTFRNPLKKFLEPPRNNKDRACCHLLEGGVYEVPRDYGGHVDYAIDLPHEQSNGTNAADTVGNMLRSLPISTFHKKMNEFLQGNIADLIKAKDDRQSFEYCTRYGLAAARSEYLRMYDTLSMESSEPTTPKLEYPHSTFRTVDMTIGALKENLLTPGWKQVSLHNSYGPGRFYIKDAMSTKKSFKDVFDEWLESHVIAELAEFNNSSGYFIYYHDATKSFKGVHSLDCDPPTVIDLDSGELYNVLDFGQEIRLLPDELKETFEPVVAAQLAENISEERFIEFLKSCEKTKKMYVRGKVNGVLAVSCTAEATVVPDITRVFCNATRCMGKCALLADSNKNAIRRGNNFQ